jgi:7-carboxy-7-deazaguanine synthase
MGGMVPCGFAGDIEKCPCRSYKGYDDSIEMLVSEIYPAISGEGLSTGRVCTIVRTVGCGLRCSYCDSVYAYDGGQKIALRDVLAMVLKYGIRMVLFTGGEPLLDEKVAGNFLRAMLENQIVTYVETNGAMDIRPFKLLAHIVMDIKTPSSGMHGRMNWNNIFYMGVTDEVKFVVSDEEDYNYAKQVMSKYKLDQITPNIFMSPVWGSDSDMSFVQALSNWMIQDKSEARLMLQQHKCIWGPKRRGV